MFRLANSDDVYPGTVVVDVPGADAPQRHPVSWRLIGDREINRLLAQSAHALLQRVIAGWGGLAHNNGAEIAFDADGLALLCDVPYWRRAAVDAYLRFVTGLPEKNCSAPPSTGGGAAAEKSASSPPTRTL